MAPLVPRMHVFEIDDQPWFPQFLRSRVQAALTQAWVVRAPFIQKESPASLVAGILKTEVLGRRDENRRRPWTMIDFCAGAGGPTPTIERIVNASADTETETETELPTEFVLTDLHPHVADWSLAAAASPHVHFSAQPVDAAAADVPQVLAAAGLADGARVFRMFSLAFHHFDDPLAAAILRNTVENSDGFGIFELQDRSLSAFVTTLVFGLGIFATAPYYAWAWRSPAVLVFTYLLPVLPFVLVFDGWMSMLRTRTPDEVQQLLDGCGADGVDQWELRSGEMPFMYPCGYLKWIVCTKK